MGNVALCKCEKQGNEASGEQNLSFFGKSQADIVILRRNSFHQEPVPEKKSFAEQNREIHLSGIKSENQISKKESKVTIAEKTKDDNANLEEEEEDAVANPASVFLSPVKTSKRRDMYNTTAAFCGDSIETVRNQNASYANKHRNQKAFRSFQNKMSCNTEIGKYIRHFEVELAQVLNTNEHIYFAEMLEKYSPGFNHIYVPRLCEAGTYSFQYYSQGGITFRKPLLKIYYKEIANVVKVNICNNNQLNHEYRFQLEINLKTDCNFKNIKKRCKVEGYRSKIEENERRASSPATSFYEKVEIGHAIPKSWLYDRYIVERNTQINKKPTQNNLFYANDISFPKLEEMMEYQKFAKLNERKMNNFIKNEVIEVKNPKKWIKGLSGPQTWNNRLIEWYTAEEQIIFSANSEEECNRWVSLLNWLVSKSY